MCGRFQQTTTPEELAARFGADAPGAATQLAAAWRPRWNVAPGSGVLALRTEEPGACGLVRLHWGLVPRWAKEAKIGHRLVNARAETAAQKPAFRDALKRRRCLVPVEAFYEWTSTGGPRLPWRVRVAGEAVFALAGLWERWQDPAAPDGPPLESCTVLTTAANAGVRPIHARMPVVVARQDEARWLDPRERDPAHLSDLLAPGERTAFLLERMSDRVNDPRHDDASVIEPV